MAARGDRPPSPAPRATSVESRSASLGPRETARAVAVLPARIGSTRLPRKMLLAETGSCLFVHTARAAIASGAFARVVVATDSAEISDAAAKAGIETVMTSADHKSGTDRVAEAWRILSAAGQPADLVVNVQGDEPELEPGDLARLVAEALRARAEIATLAAPLSSEEEWKSGGVVKVVCDARGRALYFSRAAIPARGHGTGSINVREMPARRHMGVYAFRPEMLARCAALPPSALERAESLEQLRWLEAGESILVVAASRAPAGIDTREDYEGFVARWRAAAERAAGESGTAGRAAEERATVGTFSIRGSMSNSVSDWAGDSARSSARDSTGGSRSGSVRRPTGSEGARSA